MSLRAPRRRLVTAPKRGAAPPAPRAAPPRRRAGPRACGTRLMPGSICRPGRRGRSVLIWQNGLARVRHSGMNPLNGVVRARLRAAG